MSMTFGMIKPDAVERGLSGKILDRIEAEGFRIRGLKKVQLQMDDARAFYAVHAERPFYSELCEFMSRSPIMVFVLEADDDAVIKWRDLMGATNPADATEGTLRKEFALSIGENSVHGSDSDENAATEIAFFFNQFELV